MPSKSRAAELVAQVLETQDVRVCPYCDREHNIQVGPGQAKTHGTTCRKHLDQHLNFMTAEEPTARGQFKAFYDQQPDEVFSPEYLPPAT